MNAYDLDSLYGAVLAANIPHDTHESDLYLVDRPDVRRMIDSYNRCFAPFVNQVTRTGYLDVAFAYLPFWDARRAASSPTPSAPVGGV